MKILRSKRSGFTLVEVSIALGLAAYIMVSTYSLISQGMKKQAEAISLNNALFLAKIKMAQIDSSPKLETTTSKGEIPGYIGYSYELEVKEEEMDLLKLAEGTKDGNDKTASDLLGENNNAKMDELLQKRGKASGSKTGGVIKVFRINVKIKYPIGPFENTYEVETIKSTKF
ncbi:MAG: prepilin-type N-terminal cleavage/methylation domain-containing protein [Leptospiraceae bacterium]|nr:prepilin-type N-terminal cleavage/methylation domain-containing protein [Leptospiraceae bacterium]